MAELQEYFELPIKNWYDEKGRIFKDRLITNLNAIEEKIKQIINLDPWTTESPDVRELEFEDVTLSSDDSKIVNLRSFINIMNLIGYPIECQFNNKTCVKLCYWDENYNYITIKDTSVSCDNTNKYIVLNTNTATITGRSSVTLSSNERLVGVYCDSRIRSVNEDTPIGINVLRYLANMSHDTFPVTFNSGTRDSYDSGNGIIRDGRVVGAGDTNTRTWGSNNVIFHDVGRRSI